MLASAAELFTGKYVCGSVVSILRACSLLIEKKGAQTWHILGTHSCLGMKTPMPPNSPIMPYCVNEGAAGKGKERALSKSIDRCEAHHLK